jgi:hypothetical protein
MICKTTKPGIDCFFMNGNGCQFAGGTCKQIIDKCEGCQKAQDFPTGKYCISFPDPPPNGGSANVIWLPTLKPKPQTRSELNPIKGVETRRSIIDR